MVKPHGPAVVRGDVSKGAVAADQLAEMKPIETHDRV